MGLPKAQISKDYAMELWIKERSDYAKEQLVLNNIGLVRNILKKLNLNAFDEDLFSIGLIGLVKAVNTFNADKKVKFTTYATPIIRNEILATFRKKRIMPAFSLNEPHVLDNGEEISYADMIADNRRFEEKIIADMQARQIIDFLNEKERKIVLLKMDGKTQEQIAKICGMSQSYVSRIIRNACKKCKRKFMEE